LRKEVIKERYAQQKAAIPTIPGEEKRSTDFGSKPMSLSSVFEDANSMVVSLAQEALAVAMSAKDKRMEETSFILFASAKL
jgi:hypothetical protein